MPEAQETLKEATTPMVELDTSGNAVDVELDDSKANTKEVETKKEEPKVEVKEEKKDEREEYSESVKKRIDRLTYKIREAERREKEALSFAQQIKNERDNLQTKAFLQVITIILSNTLVQKRNDFYFLLLMGFVVNIYVVIFLVFLNL